MQQVVETGHHGVYDQGFVYDEVFPALPESTPGGVQTNMGQWSNKSAKMRVGSSQITQVFHVPTDERRCDRNDSFGEKESVRICQSIMKDTDALIEISTSKDQSLTFLVTGKLDNVLEARRKIRLHFQTQGNQSISIPKDHHKWILGKAGARLKELEKETSTKITVPGISDSSDKITVIGTKENIEKAIHEISIISAEQSKKAFERIDVPKLYHPFIFGANNETLNALQAETGARIHIPPNSVDKTEITISGEKEGVALAKEKINAIYLDMEQRCATVSVEVMKTQHKYVIGQKGSGIAEILQKTGVSVEMPPSDSSKDTITLRGPQEKLGQALSMVYEKANSVQLEVVEAPEWIHKYIIGRKGENIKKISSELPRVHVEFTDKESKIKIEGPPEEVKQAKEQLETLSKDLINKLTFTMLTVDPKHFKHIIGKNGANVNKIKEQTEALINFSESSGGESIIRIEGSKIGVEKAKQELEEMVAKLENEKEKDIIIEHKYHRAIIGNKGEKIKEIRDKFNQVQITLPTPSEKRDVVKIRGPKEDVDKACKFLQKFVKDLNESSYTIEFPIYKQFHKLVIGKNGANIKKIRDETGTKIDLPGEGDVSDVIVITGKKEDVEEAKDRIQKIQNEQANIVTEEVSIAPKYYNSLIGTKGRLIRSIMDECGGVIIKFPAAESRSEKVTIRGPKEDVDRAKQQLLEMANERQQSSFTAEVRAKPQHHKFLIGKSGANIKKIRESTGCRIIIPTSNDEDQELITIIGKQEGVERAKAELEATIKEIDNVVEDEMNVDPRHHRHFVSRRGEILHRIADECGGVTISFPRPGVQSDKVVIKGAKDCIDAAKQKILEIVEDLESRVTIECIIPQKHHRSIMGSKGSKLQDITSRFDVLIKFPDKNTQDDYGQPQQPQFSYEAMLAAEAAGEDIQDKILLNGDAEEPSVKPCDIIRITGKMENCEAAKEALLSNVPITIEIDVPFEYHRSIIGQRGSNIRELSDRYDVHIEVPNSNDHLDTIKIIGTADAVENAKEAVQEKMKEIDAEKEDRVLKSFEVKLTIDPDYHPKIIGRKGAVINKIRQDHDVQIILPKRDVEVENVITILGYQASAEAARDDIMKIVNDLNELKKDELVIDSRVHSRLIGSRGRNIRQIMQQFNVEIKFPRPSDPDPNLVVITGMETNVEDAKDHLLNLEEEYMQDVSEAEFRESKTPKRSSDSNNVFMGGNNTSDSGFVVKGGPWEQKAPDTASTEAFPSLGSGGASTPHHSVSWGPRR